MTNRRAFRGWVTALARLAIGAGLAMAGGRAAHACSCDRMSPAQGFERAQYVFTGTVVEATPHTWTVAVDRVWKGADKLAQHVRLLDVYAETDCEFYFAAERAYLFFAIVAKSSRYVYYQPQVCNWTRPLNAEPVATADGAMRIEDLIVKSHGPGERPKAPDPWQRLLPRETVERK